MAYSDLYSTVSTLSADGKIIAIRALGNSAIYRLFGAADRAAKARKDTEALIDPKSNYGQEVEAYNNAIKLANQLGSIWASTSAKLESLGVPARGRPQQPSDVIEYLIRPNPMNNDRAIKQLADALGESPEHLTKLRDAALVAKAQQNAKAAERIGGDFESIALGGTIESMEWCFDTFEEITQNGGGLLVLKKLRSEYDRKLKYALTSSSGEGFSELFLLKEDIRVMQEFTDFEL